MNLIVRADGTAELHNDDIAPIVREEIPGVRLVVNLLDADRLVARVIHQPRMQDPPPDNPHAQRLIAELADIHIAFVGTVIMADLDPDLAVELLESLL